MKQHRRILPAVAAAAVFLSSAASAATLTVNKSPFCGCCAKWIEHVRQHGLAVKTVETQDLDAVAKRLRVPDAVRSCHTAEIGGYFIEGHVPAGDIQRLLSQKPKALGIAVAGMPPGAPGMDSGGPTKPFATLIVSATGKPRVYAQH